MGKPGDWADAGVAAGAMRQHQINCGKGIKEMDYYELELLGVRRKLPLIPIDREMAYASFVILGDVELISRAGKELAGRMKEVDYLVTAEAKGIPLSYEMSREMGLKEYVVLRKSVKTYMRDPLCEVVKSITTKESQHLYLDEKDAEKIKGKSVCIVDDVISTGESLKAIEKLVKRAGADVKYKVCILAEGQAADRDDIIFLEKLPLFKRSGAKGYHPCL